MRILMVARRFPPDLHSGSETVFQNLYAQARRRNEVRLVVGYRRDRSHVPPEALAVDLRGAGKADAWRRLWLAAWREERRFQPHIVLANSIEVPTLGAPAVCIVHDLNFGVASRSAGVRARELFYRFKSHRLRRVVTVSRASRAHLLRVGVPEDRLHVIHNGVDLDAFTPAPPSADGVVRFAYPGRILPGKGQHLAVDAVARLQARHKKKVHLSIVGAVNDRAFFEQLKVQAYGQPVEVVGDVPELASWYQKADVVLFPTLMEEGFGYTAIEAMACGRPVVWAEQPAIREATGGIGFPVPKGEVEAMRDTMVRLIADPDLRQRVGAEGRRYVEEHYSWAKVWQAYERLLEDAT
jgi:glycosyltransferase involved in cell wall biosynthesis